MFTPQLAYSHSTARRRSRLVRRRHRVVVHAGVGVGRNCARGQAIVRAERRVGRDGVLVLRRVEIRACTVNGFSKGRRTVERVIETALALGGAGRWGVRAALSHRCPETDDAPIEIVDCSGLRAAERGPAEAHDGSCRVERVRLRCRGTISVCAAQSDSGGPGRTARIRIAQCLRRLGVGRAVDSAGGGLKGAVGCPRALRQCLARVGVVVDAR